MSKPRMCAHVLPVRARDRGERVGQTQRAAFVRVSRAVGVRVEDGEIVGWWGLGRVVVRAYRVFAAWHV